MPSRLYFPIQPSLVVGFILHKLYTTKLKNLGLCKLYKVNKEFKKWIHQLMSLPFLTEEDIRPIYLAINLSTELNDHELKIVAFV